MECRSASAVPFYDLASPGIGDAFEKNQTSFRLEERAGFTAERYPTAFRLVAGTGLVP